MFKKFFLPPALALFLAATTVAAQDEGAPVPTDWLSFAQGVLPIAIDTGGANLRIGMTEAIAMIDGNPIGFVATPKPGTADDRVAITFSLPALTRFDRLAVPNVAETPSPSQTFFRDIAVFGATDPAGPWTLLAQGQLTAHQAKGQQSELTLTADRPEVTLVQVQLRGGMDVQRDATFFEFSEIIGNGTQQAASLATGFSGVWKGRGVDIELEQQGATVSGCYDKLSPLSGTVEGNVLRAIGTSDAGIASQFILVTDETGALRGLRSTNGAPFKLYEGEVSGAGPRCTAPEPPRLGCGAIVHGIGFDFDSDVLRPSSAPVLEALHAGLSGETAAQIRIVGHSSSEGAADYNLELSQRRAASVVRALVAMGLPATRLSASGRGEEDPIASNADEAGRSLNRRVEIECAG